jgi:hypothetical protein
MEIYLSMIHDRLETEGCKVSALQGCDVQLETIRLGKQYINHPDILSIYFDDKSKICFLCGTSSFFLYDNDLDKAFNLAIASYQYFEQWEKKLIMAVWNSADFQDLIDIAEPMFHNPIFVSNWQGKVLGFTHTYSHNEIREFWSDIVTTGQVPISCLKNLRNSPYHEIVAKKNESTLLDFQEQNYRCILGLLHSNHEIILQFQIIEHNTPLNSTDLKLANVFLRVLQQIHIENHPEYYETATSIFMQFLNSETVEQKKLDWILTTLGWNNSDCSFYLVNFEVMDAKGNAFTLFAQIERRIPGSKIILWKNNIIMLISEPIFKVFYQEILYLNHSLGLCCGVSLPFQDWNYLSISFEQAKSALCYIEENTVLSYCHDHAWTYLLDKIKKSAFSLQLIHPVINILINYDKQNETELAKTLYYYLEFERSSTLTAEKLFIHRNTLQYRIHRIHDLIDVDLENPDIRSHLMISYLLLDEKK